MEEVKEAIVKHIGSFCEILLGLAEDEPLDKDFVQEAKIAYLALYEKEKPKEEVKKELKKLIIEREGNLSQLHPFYISSFVQGEGKNAKEWMTLEHYYQGMKFKRTDPNHMEYIRKAHNGAIARRRGENASHKRPRSNWEKVRKNVLKEANLMKFEQNKEECDILLSTEDSILILKNDGDLWLGDPGDGSGENNFGLILMEVREKIRKELRKEEQEKEQEKSEQEKQENVNKEEQENSDKEEQEKEANVEKDQEKSENSDKK